MNISVCLSLRETSLVYCFQKDISSYTSRRVEMSAISLTVLVLVSILVVEKATSCNPPSWRTDGCSIPYGLPYFYKENFRPDCDKHDVCYACGARFGRSRSYCDRVFYQNILSRCNTDTSVKNTGFCRDVAFDYYLGVRLGGRSHYENPSLDWCGESWVRSCL
ncbi:uncharacterized protein LOC128553485 [Mercenaria mercenaria]|uniref:uncharacterized protein LOC128553485 n=1 Tax=Mercenaria mercenaria TaxID=6596 RepID=UPI00234E3B67|nr:uncharacterized protein LOC128553485 [Mercenaria mercenaria]